MEIINGFLIGMILGITISINPYFGGILTAQTFLAILFNIHNVTRIPKNTFELLKFLFLPYVIWNRDKIKFRIK